MVAALRDALLDCLKQKPELSLDLSGVEECDASVLQVICAARKSAAQLEKPFRVVSPSDAILNASAELGVALEDLAMRESRGAV